MCMKKFDAEKVFFDKRVTGILKMCMKKFDAEKVFFDKMTVF